MHHGYAQAEGVANLDQVPVGALVSIGYPKFAGVGGYARYIAICPTDQRGITISETKEAPCLKATSLEMGFQRGDADTLSLVSLLPRAEEGALFAGVAPGRPANKTLDAPNREGGAPARGTGSASPLLFDECFRQRERAVPVLGDTLR
jgi:hypothetical protein